MTITVKQVTTKNELRKFAGFANELYKGNKYYVPQIVSMEMDTLTPGKNHAFEVCESAYFLAYNPDGKIVGRIAAIINHRYNAKVNEKICRFGWIDFIDDRSVSEALFRTVENYAREKGLDTVSGPMGFLEFDAAGVVVDGFDQLPTAYGKYNAPYYEKHILDLGFEKENDYVEYLITIPEDQSLIDKYLRAAELVGQRENLHEAKIKNTKDIYKYVPEIFALLNKCYSHLHGFSELSKGQQDDLLKQFIPNMILDFVSVILDENGKVVAFGISLPSLAKALQKAGGRLFPFGFLHILRAMKKNDTLDLLLIGVDEKYKKSGVPSMIFAKVYQGIKKYGIKYLESTRELEDNYSVQNLWKNFERRNHKRARTYIKHLK